MTIENTGVRTADWLTHQTSGALYAYDIGVIVTREGQSEGIAARVRQRDDLMQASLAGIERWEAEHGLGQDDV